MTHAGTRRLLFSARSNRRFRAAGLRLVTLLPPNVDVALVRQEPTQDDLQLLVVDARSQPTGLREVDELGLDLSGLVGPGGLESSQAFARLGRQDLAKDRFLLGFLLLGGLGLR